MTGGNTPCKMCQLPKVGRWCLHTVRLPSAVCRLPLRTAPQTKRRPPCSVFFVLVLGLCSFFLVLLFTTMPLLARRGFPLAFRVGARWVSTPSSMPRLGAQFPLLVEFFVASPPSPRRASAATSHSSRTGGRRCVLCSIRIACFALSLSLLQHVAAILGSGPIVG